MTVPTPTPKPLHSVDKELNSELTQIVTKLYMKAHGITGLDNLPQGVQVGTLSLDVLLTVKALNTLLVKAHEQGRLEATVKRSHLKKNQYQTFCGWGLLGQVEVVEIIEDATCKSCIKLANLTTKAELESSLKGGK